MLINTHYPQKWKNVEGIHMMSNGPHFKLKYCYTGLATTNKKFYIGTSSSTVYVYDYLNRTLLCKFNDVPYADKLYLNEDETILVVKSTEPQIAIYSLVELKLMHKVRMKNTNQPQEANLCFSACGNYLYNIVYDNDLLSYVVKINLHTGTYQTLDFLPKSGLTTILYVKEHQQYYLWGFHRGIQNEFFVKIFDLNWTELKHFDFTFYVTHVEYSSKEDAFYFQFLTDPYVYKFNHDLSEIQDKILVEEEYKTIQMFGQRKQVLISKYGFTFGFSLNKINLMLAIQYQNAIVIINQDKTVQKVVKFQNGQYVRFTDAGDEVVIHNEVFSVDL